ncbi:pentatricopeptide repeat-containing protein 1, mitochondrial [Maniola hyperantus]|uniref:pentatricopeptide repeat-containing protein 1, mitochondrial n=1 Tax=Aphantopus hyperantus TaxID=2795564 RepID=UPI001569C4B9|nr:pentatricopeptide repeat-containing protein 1, mitochondrial [Maniola hyperantus]
MAFRCIHLFRNIKCSSAIKLRHNLMSTLISKDNKISEIKYKTENNITYLEDPDCFGTLVGRAPVPDTLEDEGDVKEDQYLHNKPLQSQKFTTKQYADLIKQYLKHKRIKEAIDILETRMLKEDRVKPENYIYNILIGACAEVGYTKKAFKLFNDMKRRALKPTGDTYTCLFEACINSPWPADGLKMATHLRNHMIEKGIEPNLTNYNVMIKAFGRCSDIPTAFKIVDEMISKKIKIRVHTFNHLIQACISDKDYGLKHALIVWRKMLKMREKPNVYSFNLMLKCVKDCNLGSNEDLLEVVSLIQEHMASLNMKANVLQIEDSKTSLQKNENVNHKETLTVLESDRIIEETSDLKSKPMEDINSNTGAREEDGTGLALINKNNTSLELIESYKRPEQHVQKRIAPNLLSKVVQINQILRVQEVHTPQDKFAIIGGQEDFLKEMEVYSEKPDIKTFTQMLPLIENNSEAENKLLGTMQALNIKTDIDFYNALIKKRCFRQDYDSAFEVREIIEKQNKRQKKHPLNKKHIIKVNVMTYGVLALGCKTKEKAEKLLNEMNEKQFKVNIEILGTLMKNATLQMQFGYILYVMDIVKKENIRVNEAFIKHLEIFNDRCLKIIQKNEKENRDCPVLAAAHKRFSNIYNNWLKDINIEEALKPEHPWQQFMEPHPTPVQRECFRIVEPKKFYKRNRKFVHYSPKL